METKLMMAVKLDNEHVGAGPATVVAHVASVAEFYALATDRDGARYPRMRLWHGNFPVGARVVMAQLVCGTGQGVFVPAQ